MPDAAPRTGAHAPRGLWAVPPLLLLALFFAYPLVLIFAQALTGDTGGGASFSHFLDVFAARDFHAAVLNTLVIALTATVGCLVLGFTLSLVIAFVPFPGATLVARLIDSFIALPTFLVVLAFTFIYGSAGLLNGGLMEAFQLPRGPIDFLYSRWGVILAEITVYTPFVMRPLLATFSLLDQAQIEVASSLGARPWRIVRQVIFPPALPALLAGGSLCLLLTVNEFGIVLFVGAKDVITLPMMIYDKAIQEFDYTTACVIAIVNVTLSLSLYFSYRMIVSHFGARRAGLV
jgi:2-aminoethylphosphonate transport system permease protein